MKVLIVVAGVTFAACGRESDSTPTSSGTSAPVPIEEEKTSKETVVPSSEEAIKDAPEEGFVEPPRKTWDCSGEEKELRQEKKADADAKKVVVVQVRGGPESWQERINALLMKRVVEREKDFERTLTVRSAARSSLEITCSPVFQSPQILSQECRYYDNRGGMHPSLGAWGEVIKLCDVERIELGEVCDAKCQAALRSVLKLRVKEKAGVQVANQAFGCDSCEEQPGDDWFLTVNGAVFSLYQWIPRSFAEVAGQVRLSKAELEGIGLQLPNTESGGGK